MSQPLGYYSLSHDNALIADISESWGETLSEATEEDKLWLIGRISHQLWMSSDSSLPPTPEAEQVCDRLHELKRWQKIALLKALIQ